MEKHEQEEIEQAIDFLNVATLSRNIMKAAEEAAELSQKINDEKLGEGEEREALVGKLHESVARGSAMSIERDRIFSHYPPIEQE